VGGNFWRVNSSAMSARVMTARARPLCGCNQSAFRGRRPAEMDEQSSRHGPVSLPVVSASAYHYWGREAIVRVRRPRRPAKRGRPQRLQRYGLLRPMHALLLAEEQRRRCQAWVRGHRTLDDCARRGGPTVLGTAKSALLATRRRNITCGVVERARTRSRLMRWPI
jgi:hypothetical protein